MPRRRRKRERRGLSSRESRSHQTYYNDYSRFPSSPAAANASVANPGGDFTYGTAGLTTSVSVLTGGAYDANNSELMVILMSINAGANAGNARNPKQTPYLNAKVVSGTTEPGVGSDYVYRDPFRNPYIISLDMNFDNVTFDAFYRQNAVSTGGLNGLFQNAAATAPNNWAAHRPSWSGPSASTTRRM